MNILEIDQKVLEILNNFFIGHSTLIDKLFVGLAVYLIYALPVVLIIMWLAIKAKKERISLMMSMVSLVLAVFGFNKLIAHFWYRPRPDFAAIGIKEVFFHRPDFSFPSDHAATLFAITFTLYLFGYRKAANWFLVAALLITFARVVIGVHYPLDIVGGAMVALIASLIVYGLRGFLEKYLYNPIVFILKKVRLA